MSYDKYDVANMITVVKIDHVHGLRGNNMLLFTHFNKDKQIPPFWHRLNEVQRNVALHTFWTHMNGFNSPNAR
jgi:hypothetical protein